MVGSLPAFRMNATGQDQETAIDVSSAGTQRKSHGSTVVLGVPVVYGYHYCAYDDWTFTGRDLARIDHTLATTSADSTISIARNA